MAAAAVAGVGAAAQRACAWRRRWRSAAAVSAGACVMAHAALAQRRSERAAAMKANDAFNNNIITPSISPITKQTTKHSPSFTGSPSFINNTVACSHQHHHIHHQKAACVQFAGTMTMPRNIHHQRPTTEYNAWLQPTNTPTSPPTNKPLL